MPRHLARKLLCTYALLVLLTAFGYARYDGYIMDGDGTSFLDIAQALDTHHPALAVNAYWNPGYPAVLAFAERLAHPSLWRELVVARYANVAVVALALAACLFFTTQLDRARSTPHPDTPHALSAPALHLLGMALLALSLARELPVAAARSDTLLFTLLLFAAGLLLRVLSSPRQLWSYAALGLTLGLAYLTKSFAFLPALVLILALLLRAGRQPDRRPSALLAAALCTALFACVAGPYIVAISRQLGHLTTGESARLNYAFFVDLTPRWHEWFQGDLGHAKGVFVHPETPLATQPPVFSYARHPRGTYPLWFDPAWWTLGLKPHIWIKGQLLRLLRNIALLIRFLLGRPEPFVLLAVLLAFGARWPPLRQRRSPTDSPPAPAAASLPVLLAPLAWGLLMLAIYFPVDLQDRYLTAPLFLLLLPLFAALRLRQTAPHQPSLNTTPRLATALVVLFATLILSQAVIYLADKRRHTPTAEQGHPGFDPQIFTAAAALQQLGLRPGDSVACMGDLACYTDFYWARLAGVQILGEVETPHEANPLTVWNSIPDKDAVTAPLARLGLRCIVSLLPNSAGKPEGWVQLGNSNFFAYPLGNRPSPATAASIGAYRP